MDISTEFPWAGSAKPIYCNAASTGPLPRSTARVLDEWTRLRSEPWRISLDDQLGALAHARELCASLIGADSAEIALVPNTSTGINIAAGILEVPRDKVILGNDGEFPSNVYPWMAIDRRGGARFEQIALGDGGLPDWDAVERRLDLGDVGLLAVSWVSFVSGDRANLEKLGALCDERDVWFVVDGIQGVGTTPIDVHKCRVDILSAGAQKWLLSPWGSGFCYIRRELIAQLDPQTVGWLAMSHAEDFSRMLNYDLTYFDDARKFEVATIAYQDLAGMNASLELRARLGEHEVVRRITSLATRLVDGLATSSRLRLITSRDPERRAGIVSCEVPDSAGVSRALTEAGVIHSIRGGGVVRFSPHIYNTEQDIDTILSVLDG